MPGNPWNSGGNSARFWGKSQEFGIPGEKSRDSGEKYPELRGKIPETNFDFWRGQVKQGPRLPKLQINNIIVGGRYLESQGESVMSSYRLVRMRITAMRNCLPPELEVGAAWKRADSI